MADKLPLDIWWKIITYLWSDRKDFHDFHDYHGVSYPFISLDKYKKTFGKSLTSDLFLFRRLFKKTKRAVDKYTYRYKSKITSNYHIVFKYSKNNNK